MSGGGEAGCRFSGGVMGSWACFLAGFGSIERVEEIGRCLIQGSLSAGAKGERGMHTYPILIFGAFHFGK